VAYLSAQALAALEAWLTVRCQFSPYNVPAVFTNIVPGVFGNTVPAVFTPNVPAPG
jgi:hypothetical protein